MEKAVKGYLHFEFWIENGANELYWFNVEAVNFMFCATSPIRGLERTTLLLQQLTKKKRKVIGIVYKILHPPYKTLSFTCPKCSENIGKYQTLLKISGAGSASEERYFRT